MKIFFMGLFNFKTYCFFKEQNFTISSDKEVEEVDNATNFCPISKKQIAKIATSRQLDFSKTLQFVKKSENKTTTKGKYQLGGCLKFVFGFVEHQKEFRINYIMKNTAKKWWKKTKVQEFGVHADAAAREAANHVREGVITIFVFSWYVQHYTPNVSQQKLLSEKNVFRAATQLSYNKKSCFTQVITAENSWINEYGHQIGSDNLICVKVGYLRRDQLN